jgi:hypothetical protein
LERGGITPSSPPHPNKTLLKKKTNPNPSPPFLKAPFISCNSFNLIELSIPYTYWNPMIKNLKTHARGEKKTKNLNPFAFPKFLPINPSVPPPNFIN